MKLNGRKLIEFGVVAMRLMGRRSSHTPLAIRLAEIANTGPDTEREQSYRREVRPQSDGQQP